MTEWASGLGDLKPEELRRGLDTWQEAWPPSLPEFHAACKGQKGEHNSAAYRFTPALPKPKADPEKARAEIEKMRQCLNR